jgi:hypothetical protein
MKEGRYWQSNGTEKRFLKAVQKEKPKGSKKEMIHLVRL